MSCWCLYFVGIPGNLAFLEHLSDKIVDLLTCLLKNMSTEPDRYYFLLWTFFDILRPDYKVFKYIFMKRESRVSAEFDSNLEGVCSSGHWWENTLNMSFLIGQAFDLRDIKWNLVKKSVIRVYGKWNYKVLNSTDRLSEWWKEWCSVISVLLVCIIMFTHL